MVDQNFDIFPTKLIIGYKLRINLCRSDADNPAKDTVYDFSVEILIKFIKKFNYFQISKCIINN